MIKCFTSINTTDRAYLFFIFEKQEHGWRFDVVLLKHFLKKKKKNENRLKKKWGASGWVAANVWTCSPRNDERSARGLERFALTAASSNSAFTKRMLLHFGLFAAFWGKRKQIKMCHFQIFKLWHIHTSLIHVKEYTLKLTRVNSLMDSPRTSWKYPGSPHYCYLRSPRSHGHKDAGYWLPAADNKHTVRIVIQFLTLLFSKNGLRICHRANFFTNATCHFRSPIQAKTVQSINCVRGV